MEARKFPDGMGQVMYCKGVVSEAGFYAANVSGGSAAPNRVGAFRGSEQLNVTTPGGFSSAAFPYPASATNDPIGANNGALAICVLHPAFMTPRCQAMAKMFCKYRIRKFALSYRGYAPTSASGEFFATIMETSVPWEIRETCTVLSYPELAQTERCGVTPAWKSAQNLSVYNYKGNEWFSCLTQEAEAAPNPFVSDPSFWGDDPASTSAASVVQRVGNAPLCQAVLLAGCTGNGGLTSPIAAGSYYRNTTGYWEFDVEIEFKDLCMYDNAMHPVN